MRLVLPAVLVGHILLISTQVGIRPGTTLLESAVFGTLAGAQGLVDRAGAGIRDTVSMVVGLREAQRENEALRADYDALRMRLQEQRALTHRTTVLVGLRELRRSLRWRTVSARVIGTDATPYFRTLTVDRGASDDVQPDHAVLSPSGVVGRIVGPPSRSAAKVQLLNDRNAGAGASIERTGTTGVVAGTDEASALQMRYVSTASPVVVGDVVLTTGDDGIYPPGLLIGTVAAAEHAGGPSQTIRIAPAVDFSKLQHVLIVVPARGAEADTSLISGGSR
ncbi:MAG: rod shape-determining protein MreC [Acidobacteria bacterium]|nr:rod shape-determining protein MreC [Acidobacteriota bacterium]